MVVLCWASPYLGVNEFYYFFISVLNYRVGWVFYKASRYNPQQNRYLYQHKGHTEPVQSSPSAICFCFVCFLQAVIMENEVLPKIFLDFLNIRHFPSVPKTESCGWVETSLFCSIKKKTLLYPVFFTFVSGQALTSLLFSQVIWYRVRGIKVNACVHLHCIDLTWI